MSAGSAGAFVPVRRRWHRLWRELSLAEVSGAFGDVGTFLPLLVRLAALPGPDKPEQAAGSAVAVCACAAREANKSRPQLHAGNCCARPGGRPCRGCAGGCWNAVEGDWSGLRTPQPDIRHCRTATFRPRWRWAPRETRARLRRRAVRRRRFGPPASEGSGGARTRGGAQVGLVQCAGLDLGTTLVATGAYNIALGAAFGIPLPVQPMKAIAAVALSREGLDMAEVTAAGLFVSGVVFLLGATRLINVFNRRAAGRASAAGSPLQVPLRERAGRR
jgi:hypothetical protein